MSPAALRPSHVQPMRNPFTPTEAIGRFLSRQNAISVTAQGKLEEEWGAEAWVRPLGNESVDMRELHAAHARRIDEAEQILEARRARPLRVAVVLFMSLGLATFVGVADPQSRQVLVNGFIWLFGPYVG